MINSLVNLLRLNKKKLNHYKLKHLKLCLAVKKEKDIRFLLTKEKRDLEKTDTKRNNNTLLE